MGYCYNNKKIKTRIEINVMSKFKKIEINEEHLEKAIGKVHKLILSKTKEIEHELSLFNDPYQKYKIIKESKKFLSKILKRVTRKIELEFDYLEELEREVVNTYIKDLRKMPSILKGNIRKIEDKDFRKALNKEFRAIKEEEILSVIKKGLVSWHRRLSREDGVGKGMDERVVELPLALEMGEFSLSGYVLDAGAALNLGYIKENVLSNTNARLVHFTQSAYREELLPMDDKISYMFGDLRYMPFKDEFFDRVLCISTIEHIGMDNTRYGGKEEYSPDSYIDAIAEMLRVLKTGGKLFITFPYGEAQDLGWYRIFDAREVDKIKARFVNCKIEDKYYYYNGCWFEGDATPLAKDKKDTSYDITGIAAIYIEKC